MTGPARAVGIAAALLVAGSASAHRLSPGFFGLTETAPGQYAAQWKVSISGGLAETLSPQMPDGCEVSGAVRLYVLDDLQTPNDVRLQHANVSCDRPLAGGVFAVAGLEATDTDVLLQIDYADGRSFTHRLVPSRPSVVIPERPGTLDVVTTYTVLGVEHILIGIDHLLFVLALLLLVRGVGRLVATVTAFTIAHSITLAAATLGLVSVTPAAVEAVIALSILFLATELARRDSGGTGAPGGTDAPDGAGARVMAGGTSGEGGGTVAPGRASAVGEGLTTRFPWVVAFSFGLLHGFGFAGVLGEIGLPADSVPLALLFFNIGVEIGQLLFIAAVLCLGLLLRRFWRDPSTLSPRWAAYVIGSVSAFWVFERTLSTIQL